MYFDLYQKLKELSANCPECLEDLTELEFKHLIEKRKVGERNVVSGHTGSYEFNSIMHI